MITAHTGQGRWIVAGREARFGSQYCIRQHQARCERRSRQYPQSVQNVTPGDGAVHAKSSIT